MSLAISLPKRLLVGRPLSSARMFDTPAATDTAPVTGGLLLVAVVLRSFASGCTALTGVEAVSNGVPNFRPPRARTRRGRWRSWPCSPSPCSSV